MILDLLSIFRARRDPALAAKLAARLVQAQAIERVTAPVLLIHGLLWAVVLACIVLVVLAGLAGVRLHWSAALPGLLPLFIGALAGFVSIGLKAGLDRIKDMATGLSDRAMDGAAVKAGTLKQRISTRPNEAPPRSQDAP